MRTCRHRRGRPLRADVRRHAPAVRADRSAPPGQNAARPDRPCSRRDRARLRLSGQALPSRATSRYPTAWTSARLRPKRRPETLAVVLGYRTPYRHDLLSGFPRVPRHPGRGDGVRGPLRPHLRHRGRNGLDHRRRRPGEKPPFAHRVGVPCAARRAAYGQDPAALRRRLPSRRGVARAFRLPSAGRRTVPDRRESAFPAASGDSRCRCARSSASRSPSRRPTRSPAGWRSGSACPAKRPSRGWTRCFPTHPPSPTTRPWKPWGSWASSTSAPRPSGCSPKGVPTARSSGDPAAMRSRACRSSSPCPASALGRPTTCSCARFHYTDGFPAADYGVKLGFPGLAPKEIERLSEAWRPYRSYAVMSLWCAPHD